MVVQYHRELSFYTVNMKKISLSNIQETDVSHNPKIKKRVMLKENEVDHLMFLSQAIFPPGEMAATHHHHDMTEIFFVSDGSGTFTVNGHEHKLEPGDCLVISPDESHMISNTGNDSLILTYFALRH